MTDLRHDVSELLADGPTTVTGTAARGVNPYAAPAERVTEPVRSDPYAALREDAEAREANEFALPTISSLSGVRPPTEEADRVLPPEPVLSEAVLVAAGLLEPEAGGEPTEVLDAAAGAATPSSVNEGTFADFLHDESAGAEDEPDLTEVFAGLEPVEIPVGVWRRGDDDVIGSGTTASRSAKRRSLRLRRRAA